MIVWCSLLVAFSTIHAAWSFSCGTSAIPFRLEVLADGTPVLGCATPNCFGGGAGGVGFDPDTEANDAIEGKDGLQREQDLAKDRWRHPDAEPQRAECFESPAASCPPNHWVGGLSSKSSLEIQCCKYKGLSFSKVLTRAIVRPGEVFTGGEVLINDRQTQFDLISDVRKVISDDGSISYNFTVARMACIPDAPEKTIAVHASADDIVAVLSGQANPVGNEEPRRQALEVNPRRNGEVDSEGLEPLNKNSNIPDLSSVDSINEKLEGEQSSARGTGGAKAFQAVNQQFGGGQGNVIQGNVANGQGRLVGQVPQRPTQFTQPKIIGYQPVQAQVVGQGAAVGQAPYGGGFGGGYGQPGIPLCFTADSLVETDEGQKRMDELAIGDRVMAVEHNQTTYVPVISFIHRLPTKVGQFHRIESADGQVLKMTSKHFLYVVRCDDPLQRRRLVYAEDATTDDCVHRVSSDNQGFVPTPIVSNTVFDSTGIYAPMTSTGDIVVDNVLVSCHSIVHGQSLVQTFFQGASYYAEWTKWVFGVQSDDGNTVELSPAVDFLVSVLDLVVPKELLMK